MPTKTLNAPTDIPTIAKAARHEPVTIVSGGKAAFVAVSPIEFDRLEEQDRIRREARDALREVMARMQAYASKQGLTEAELEQLLADES